MSDDEAFIPGVIYALAHFHSAPRALIVSSIRRHDDWCTLVYVEPETGRLIHTVRHPENCRRIL